MNARESGDEKISALVDGEINYCAIESALAAVKDRNSLHTWDVYHHIGDILRSETNAGNASDAFMQRFRMRFEHELPHGQPARVVVDIPRARADKPTAISRTSVLSSLFNRRFAMPGAAAAIAAIIAFVNAPVLTTSDVAAQLPSAKITGSSAGILKAANDGNTVAVKLEHPTPIPVVMPEPEKLLQASQAPKFPVEKKHLSAPVYKNNSGINGKEPPH